MIYPIALASNSVITAIVVERGRFMELHRAGERFIEEVVRKGRPLYGVILSELREQTVPEKGSSQT